MHGRVHGTYTAVNTGRKDGRVRGTRPVHGHVYGTYAVGYGPRTRPCFATYRLRTRPCSGHGRTMCMARVRPCTQFVHGRGRPCTVCTRPSTAVYRLCTRPCTGHVHGASVTVYTACTRPCRRPCLRPVCTEVYLPCTWSRTRPFTACTDRVHWRATAVYIVRPRPCTGYTYTVVYSVHGRVYGPCTRPPTAVYTVYTAVHGPRTWSVRDPITAVYTARTRPCTVNTAVLTARVHGIVRTVNQVHAVSINETNFAQHKRATIFMNRSS